MRRRDLLFLVLAAVCWGLGTVVSKRALDEFPPFTLLPIQLLASLAFLGVLVRLEGRPLGSAPPVLARLGLLNPGLAYALSLVGLQAITASLSVVLWAVEPLLIVVLAALVLGEALSRRLAVGTAGAAAGMVIVAGDPSGANATIGIVLTVAGVVCCAIYSVVSRRLLPDAESTAAVVVGQQAYALVVAAGLVAATAILGGPVTPGTVTEIGLASAIASGALYYGGAYWFFLRALRSVAASRAVVAFYLIPIVGLAAGGVLLGERLGPVQWLGAGLILVTSGAIVLGPSEARGRVALV